MVDSITPNIKITNQTEGGNNNTWGAIADTNFETIDNKFGDMTSITTTGGNTTLTDNQEIVAILYVDGTLAANATITFSGRGGFWIVYNNTTGDYTLTCKVSGQTGVVIPQAGKRLIYCDGTDILLGNTETSVAEEVLVASATTCDIFGAGSEFIRISGTTTITSFGSTANQKRFVRATGAFKITHNASTLILPGAQNITTASGDTFIVISDASGNARVYAYQRVSQPPPVMPIGTILDYAGSSAPSYFLLCYGQAISRTTYAALFAAIGVTYGAGDSTTTFNLPDCRGRVVAGKDNMGGTSANRLTNQSGGLNGDTLGDTGGAETGTLARANLPNVTLTVTGTTSTDGSHEHNLLVPTNFNESGSGGIGAGATSLDTNVTVTDGARPSGSHNHTVSGSTSSINGGVSQTDVNNVQPTIIFNKIIFAGV